MLFSGKSYWGIYHQCSIYALRIMSTKLFPVCEQVLEFSIAADSFSEQVSLIMRWGQQRLSRVVCVANVHMLMEGHWNKGFRQVLHHADLLTPDGMPLVWTMNLLRKRPHDRVCGMDIMRGICQQASLSGLKVFFLGTDDFTLAQMQQRLQQEFPDLQIAGMEPLPFRPLTLEEDDAVVDTINQSGAGILFVALGCPKQEIWMHQHKNQIQAVMVGVGGAFPMYAGIKKRAPRWVQAAGLEWFYRLVQEPGRLWKRYSTTIPPFIMLSAKQIITSRVKGRLSRVLSGRQVG